MRTLGGGAGSGCFDDASFKDAKGYACMDWSGYDCLGGGVSRLGYSDSDMEAVRASCRKSCNLCGGGGDGNGNTAGGAGNGTLPGHLSGLAQAMELICGESCLLEACQSIRKLGGACDVWVYGAAGIAMLILSTCVCCCSGPLRCLRCCGMHCPCRRRFCPVESNDLEDPKLLRERAETTLSQSFSDDYYDDEDQEEEDAAIEIQRNVRGMQGRQRAAEFAEKLRQVRESERLDRDMEESNGKQLSRSPVDPRDGAAVSHEYRASSRQTRQELSLAKEKKEGACLRCELDMHISEAGKEGSHERAVFRIQIVRELAVATGLKKQYFRIKRISAGSIVVDLEISPAGDPQEQSAHSPIMVAKELEEQGRDANSHLRSCTLMRNLVSITIPSQDELARWERQHQQEDRALAIAAMASERAEREAKQKVRSKQALLAVNAQKGGPGAEPTARENRGAAHPEEKTESERSEGKDSVASLEEAEEGLKGRTEEPKALKASCSLPHPTAGPEETEHALKNVAARKTSAAEIVIRELARHAESRRNQEEKEEIMSAAHASNGEAGKPCQGSATETSNNSPEESVVSATGEASSSAGDHDRPSEIGSEYSLAASARSIIDHSANEAPWLARKERVSFNERRSTQPVHMRTGPGAGDARGPRRRADVSAAASYHGHTGPARGGDGGGNGRVRFPKSQFLSWRVSILVLMHIFQSESV